MEDASLLVLLDLAVIDLLVVVVPDLVEVVAVVIDGRNRFRLLMFVNCVVDV